MVKLPPKAPLHTEVWTRFAAAALVALNSADGLPNHSEMDSYAEDAAVMADALYAEWLKRVA